MVYYYSLTHSNYSPSLLTTLPIAATILVPRALCWFAYYNTWLVSEMVA